MKATNEKTAELLARLHDGATALAGSDEWKRYLTTAAKFHNYSWLNRLSIHMQRPNATQVAGFRRWQELGRQVRKGETGIAILAPVTIKIKAKDCRDHDACNGHTRLVGFKTVHVFDIAQTDGEPLPEPTVRLLDGDAPVEAWHALAAQVTEAGFELVRETHVFCPTANGVTDYTNKRVSVRPDVSDLQACKTLAHELAHVMLHTPGTHDLSDGAREVEAESVAYVVMARLGLDSAEYSFGYLAGWAGGKREVMEATADRVIKTADAITAKLESLVAA